MSKFRDTVLNIVRSVPKGTVVNYGQVALMAGIPRAAIQVGWVLHTSENEDGIPWWRVINGQGRISTTCLEHTAQDQKRLLEKEGVKVTDKLKIDIEKYRYRPSIKEVRGLKLPEEYIYTLIDKYNL